MTVEGSGSRLRLGEQGERLAEAFLVRRGAQVVQRNWRARPTLHGVRGELDLIVRQAEVLVGVEVKTRRGIDYGHPFDAVDEAKLRRLHLLLAAWAGEHGWLAERRVDVIAVLVLGGPGHERVRLEHREGLH